MRTFLRRVSIAVGLLGALTTLAFVSTRPTPDQRAERLLASEVADWTDPDARAAVTAELQRENPEWDFMHRTFLALSLVDRALAHPDEADRWLPIIDRIAQSQLDDRAAHGDPWFQLPYARNGPYRDPSGRSVFVDGEIALVLGARRFVRDDPTIAAQHRALVEAMAAQFARSPALLPESYPDEVWMFCNTNALVAIRMGDLLDGTDHQALIDDWVARAHGLIERDSGLLGSEYTWSGQPLDGPEGSSIWLVATNLRVLDPAFAQGQYDGARAALVGDVLGLGYAREWGPGWHGPVDVDSGPIVPILQASPSSSGFALMAARAFGDRPTDEALRRSLGAADLLTTVDPRLAELAANPMGDVIVLHALTFGPLWERVGAGRPVWMAADLGVGPDGVDAALARAWDEPYTGITADQREVSVGSCTERLAQGERFAAWDEYRTWDGKQTFQRCFALDLLRRAQPARVSHVGSFRLDAQALDQLPPTLGWRVSEEADHDAVQAEAAGLSWSAADPSAHATLQADGSLQIAGVGYWQSLVLLGRADFDGDGVEDLLLGSTQGADGGTLTIVAVDVVTRTVDGGPLRLASEVATGG